MGRLDKYNVELKDLKEQQAQYQWTVDQDFFSVVEGDEVRNGKVDVNLAVTKASGLYKLFFSVAGTVVVTCDRCLDDMPLQIENSGELKVKLGADFGDDGDVVIVPEVQGFVNVAWYIYEFIALAIPIKHVHAPGKCNKGMMEKLDELTVGEDQEEQTGQTETDPRWDDLKNMIENDND
ncbi:MAG: DUF177 domain-containing protein [Bacteroidaceae bacterium]|nr:DUF177 domain-containing protein [Bacteroidaceae bacterium]